METEKLGTYKEASDFEPIPKKYLKNAIPANGYSGYG